MSLRENIIKIWKSKGQILEGVTNSIFKREDVEVYNLINGVYILDTNF
jgi:hypothetical protein